MQYGQDSGRIFNSKQFVILLYLVNMMLTEHLQTTFGHTFFKDFEWEIGSGTVESKKIACSSWSA